MKKLARKVKSMSVDDWIDAFPYIAFILSPILWYFFVFRTIP